MDCDLIQGYYFAKPMPIAEFEEKMTLDSDNQI
jgi:EAL domain-containing protein (putative c-di-GMP-specific phosphodiesterase class I)